jgi:hypothetical protein
LGAHPDVSLLVRWDKRREAVDANLDANAGSVWFCSLHSGASFQNECHYLHLGALSTINFKTAAFDRSATPPRQ